MQSVSNRFPFRLPLIAAIAGLLLALTGCGTSANESIVHIDGSSGHISKATLNHWMRATAGGDFRQIIGTKGPQGLVAEPPNYDECAEAAKKIIPRSFTGQLKLSEAEIQKKCRELYRSLKAQTITFLISALWEIQAGKEQGVSVSETKLRKEFARFRKEMYPTEAELQTYMAERHWRLSDILYQLKRNILVSEMLPKLEAEVAKAGGGQARYRKLVQERFKRLVARTSCKPGYVARNCREYDEKAGHSTAPPNVIFEQFVTGAAD